MHRPLITHDNNHGTDYYHDYETGNTSFSTNPFRWDQSWYLNNKKERSAI